MGSSLPSCGREGASGGGEGLTSEGAGLGGERAQFMIRSFLLFLFSVRGQPRCLTLRGGTRALLLLVSPDCFKRVDGCWPAGGELEHKPLSLYKPLSL